jgi:hypothetical protein
VSFCIAPRNDGKPCGRDTLIEGEHCIFHEPGPKDATAFRDEFVQLAARTEKVLDATSFVFPHIVLHKVEFPHHVLFQRARFTAHLQFSECTFHEGADFIDARFEGPVLFLKSLLRHSAGFRRAAFAEEADFQGSTFEGGCDFIRSRFRGRTSFKEARFIATARDGRRFGLFDFIEAEFQGPRFWRASFKDVAQFTSIGLAPPQVPDSLLERRGGLRPSMDFSHVRVERADGLRFTGPSHPFPDNAPSEDMFQGRNEPLDLRGLSLDGSDVVRMQFADVRWGAEGKDWLGDHADDGVIFDELALLPTPGSLRSRHDWTGNQPAGERLALLYKGLRESYERHLLFAEAGRFHIREMECRRRAMGSHLDARSSNAQTRLRRTAWEILGRLRRTLSPLGMYRFSSNYGESYVRAFWSTLIWFFLVAAFEVWLRPLWFPHPVGWPHILANRAIALMPAQVAGDSLTDFVGRLVGAFLIAGLVIALRRHFRR